MKAVGTVEKINGNEVIVKVNRKSACASCNDCGAKGTCHAQLIFGEANDEVLLPVKNKIGAAVGDKVELESSTSKTLLLSVCIFVLPFFLSLFTFLACISLLHVDEAVSSLVFLFSFVLYFFILTKAMNKYAMQRVSITISKIL